MEHERNLQDLFAKGYRDFPHADPSVGEAQPYVLGFSAAAELARIEEHRLAILDRVKELSGGAVAKRVGFV